MPRFLYRELEPPPEVKARFLLWIERLDKAFGEHTSYEQRSEIVRTELQRMFTPHPSGSFVMGSSGDALVELSMDPRNVTFEAEYYGDVDAARYNQRKPLIYFWQMFDRSPLGINVWLGLRVRAMLARHIFKHIGKNVKIFHNVEFSFGYNLMVEDDCTIHRNVLLDDRGGIILHKGTSVSDYANIYSHTHDVHEQADVTNKLTEIGPRARITYHATVLAGSRVGEDAMLGAMGVATRDIDAHVVSLGIPARPKRLKARGQDVPRQAAVRQAAVRPQGLSKSKQEVHS